MERDLDAILGEATDSEDEDIEVGDFDKTLAELLGDSDEESASPKKVAVSQTQVQKKAVEEEINHKGKAAGDQPLRAEKLEKPASSAGKRENYAASPSKHAVSKQELPSASTAERPVVRDASVNSPKCSASNEGPYKGLPAELIRQVPERNAQTAGERPSGSRDAKDVHLEAVPGPLAAPLRLRTEVPPTPRVANANGAHTEPLQGQQEKRSQQLSQQEGYDNQLISSPSKTVHLVGKVESKEGTKDAVEIAKSSRFSSEESLLQDKVHKESDAELSETPSSVDGCYPQSVTKEENIFEEAVGEADVGSDEDVDEDHCTSKRHLTAFEQAEENERRQASSGAHLEEGAAAQPMQLEGQWAGPPAIGLLKIENVGTLSSALGTATMRKEHGTPQAIAVHPNFVAVGLSRGGVLVTQGRFSGERLADQTQDKAFLLGVSGQQPSVTALDMHPSGELLLVGYADGGVTLWDLARSAPIKAGLAGEYSSSTPVLVATFMAPPPDQQRTSRALTGDAKGVVLLHTFTSVPLLRRYTTTVQCLLDGQQSIGAVLGIRPFIPSEDGAAGLAPLSLHADDKPYQPGSGLPPAPPPSPTPQLSSGSLDLGRKFLSDAGGNLDRGLDIGKRFLYDAVSNATAAGKAIVPGVEQARDASEQQFLVGLIVLLAQQAVLVVRVGADMEVLARYNRPDTVRENTVPYCAWRRPQRWPLSVLKQLEPPPEATSPLPPQLPRTPPPPPPPKSPLPSPSPRAFTRQRSSPAAIMDGASTSSPAEPALRSSQAPPQNHSRRIPPLLAIGWDRQVAITQLGRGELRRVGKRELPEGQVAAVGWLEDSVLAVLTTQEQVYLFTVDEEKELERARIGSGNEGSLLVCHQHVGSSVGAPVKAYHNGVAVRAGGMYLLGPAGLKRGHLLHWQERLEALKEAGDWMGAFHTAMALHDGKARGILGVPSNPASLRSAITPFLLSLLAAYIGEAMAYVNVALSAPSRSAAEDQDFRVMQYAGVGGVVIEFCVHIGRPDLLFGDVFAKFTAVGHRGTFLELLEPYILKDMLMGLAPEVMQALVEHYSERGWLDRVERCVLHMDIASLDFNQVVRLCRQHMLYSALIYMFSKGLNDFVSPLEELLTVARNPASPHASAFGYKLLVYLKHCFLGLAFPPGHGNLPPQRLPSLRAELLQFLLAPEELQSRHPRLRFLFALDCSAALEVLGLAFPETGPLGVGKYGHAYEGEREPGESPSVVDEEGVNDGDLYIQMIVDAILDIIESNSRAPTGPPAGSVRRSLFKGDRSTEESFTEQDAAKLLSFCAKFAASGHAGAPISTVRRLLEHLIAGSSHSPEPTSLDKPTDRHTGHDRSADVIEETDKQERESLAVALLRGALGFPFKAIAGAKEGLVGVREQAEEAQFWQTVALLYAAEGLFSASLDAFLNDSAKPNEPFVFLKQALSQQADLREAVLERLPRLVGLDAYAAACLVAEHFPEEGESVLQRLADFPRLQFEYLRGVVLARAQESAVPDEEVQLTDLLQRAGMEVKDEVAELYVGLMCQFEPSSVLPFLESHEAYRLEQCLALCQNYGVTDGAAYLLERMGDVAGALALVLEQVEHRMSQLDSALAASAPKWKSEADAEEPSLEVQRAEEALAVAVALCQRNTQRMEHAESEALWFRLLDEYVEPIRLLKLHNPSGAPKQAVLACSRNSIAAMALRRVLAKFISQVMFAMMGHVPLQSILVRIVQEHGGDEFGDFRSIILGMLGTFGYEKAILEAAKSLIEADTFKSMEQLRRSRSHAYAPKRPLCCVCNRPLEEAPSSSEEASQAAPPPRRASEGAQPKRSQGAGPSSSQRSSLTSASLTPPSLSIFACGHAAHSTCMSEALFCPICDKKGGANGPGKIAVQEEVSERRGSDDEAVLLRLERVSREQAKERSRLSFMYDREQQGSIVYTNDAPDTLNLAPPALAKPRTPPPRSPLRLTGTSSRGRSKRPKAEKPPPHVLPQALYRTSADIFGDQTAAYAAPMDDEDLM